MGAEEIFSDYAYFSSFAHSWVEAARKYASMAINRLALNHDSLVIEIASNDGYLLKHFIEARVPSLGIEPAANVAKVAEENGVPTEVAFFNFDTARQLHSRGIGADLIVANNVLAHVPDLNDFISGFPVILNSSGVITVEFPHLLNLINEVQFDTIYHEHYSYLSLMVVERMFKAHGLRVFDVEELSTHGGSLRVYACHSVAEDFSETTGLRTVREKERQAGLDTLSAYDGFESKVHDVRDDLLSFLNTAQQRGKTVAAYGAAAKGNTLLNYCGVDTSLIEYVVDRNTEKQGRFLPGSHLPIYDPDHIFETKPDYVLILPWNLRVEIMSTMSGIREWGGKFVTAIPKLCVHD